MTDRDPQTESQAQISGVIQAIKSLEGQIPGVIRAIESGEKWHIGATVGSVLIAVIALALSGVVYFGTAKREADVAASEALMGHFEFASQHPEPPNKMVAKHGIYTANIIVDLTEAPGERAPWHSTARALLSKYKGHILKEGLPCDELDREFKTLVKSTLDNKVECTNGGPPPLGGGGIASAIFQSIQSYAFWVLVVLYVVGTLVVRSSGRGMQNPRYVLRRIRIPRTPVNKGKRKGRGYP